jgi:hypothetical protein
MKRKKRFGGEWILDYSFNLIQNVLNKPHQKNKRFEKSLYFRLEPLLCKIKNSGPKLHDHFSRYRMLMLSEDGR